jgi:hypothetical protein
MLGPRGPPPQAVRADATVSPGGMIANPVPLEIPSWTKSGFAVRGSRSIQHPRSPHLCPPFVS